MNMRNLMKRCLEKCFFYQDLHSIKKNRNWILLKLQEEMGELTQSYLEISEQSRQRGKTTDQKKEALEKEFADVLGFLLAFAEQENVDIEQALEKKWFSEYKK